MLVIYHDFVGNLPFTGILQEVYGLPYATSTLTSTISNGIYHICQAKTYTAVYSKTKLKRQN